MGVSDPRKFVTNATLIISMRWEVFMEWVWTKKQRRIVLRVCIKFELQAADTCPGIGPGVELKA